MRDHVIGVDTGGTYTDAVVLHAASGQVLARAKALTTKGDLSIGVSEAMSAALDLTDNVAASSIGLVSVSTTLATNAVVEGHGSPVAVVLIGFDETMIRRTGIAAAFPGIAMICIAGGHDHNGAPKTKLDEAALRAEVEKVAPGVAAFAVAASFAVRNAAHELAARDIIVEMTGKPVTLSSELSSALDAPRRALTAVLNARLISRISVLIEAVAAAMASFGISAPLMIVKGDGSLALAETVALRPIETILSGPAASLVGAAKLSGLKDFVMSDMGGTTTDLGILSGGRPMVSELGAQVGGWRTMVRAIDARTVGLGGDSDVTLDVAGKLTVGPRRVVPLSLLGSRHPAIRASLEAQLSDAMGGAMGQFVFLLSGQNAPHLAARHLSPREEAVFELVSEQPQAVARIAASSGQQRTLSSLHRKGLIQLAGFTPSDAAHVLGLQDNWCPQTAMLGARIMARKRDEANTGDAGAVRFCQDVWDEVVALSCLAVLDAVMGETKGIADSAIVQAVCSGRAQLGRARVSICPELPLVAVGGPAKVYYDAVGQRLSTEVVFQENCDVANAVGAASGVVMRQVSIEVTGSGSGAFKVLGVDEVETFASAGKAIDRARAKAGDAAIAAVLAMGAIDPDLKTTVEKRMLPDAVDDNGLLSATVTAEAVGRPSFAGS